MKPILITLNLPAETLVAELQRSARRRRTIAICIQKDGRVLVRAPLRVSAQEVERFLTAKSAWILARLKKHAGRPAAAPRNSFRFLGQSHPLRVEKSALLRGRGFCEWRNGVLEIFIPGNLTPAKARKAAQDALDDWQKKKAAEILADRANVFAARLGITYQSIKLADPKSRWGSCDKSGNMMFSWRIVMEAPELLDYLVAHELCHIIHFDHSKAYWNTVASILPDYPTRRKALQMAERTTHQPNMEMPA